MALLPVSHLALSGHGLVRCTCLFLTPRRCRLMTKADEHERLLHVNAGKMLALGPTRTLSGDFAESALKTSARGMCAGSSHQWGYA